MLYSCITKIPIVLKQQKNHPAEKIQCKNKAPNIGVMCTTVLLKDGIKTAYRHIANSMLHTNSLQLILYHEKDLMRRGSSNCWKDQKLP